MLDFVHAFGGGTPTDVESGAAGQDAIARFDEELRCFPDRAARFGEGDVGEAQLGPEFGNQLVVDVRLQISESAFHRFQGLLPR